MKNLIILISVISLFTTYEFTKTNKTLEPININERSLALKSEMVFDRQFVYGIVITYDGKYQAVIEIDVQSYGIYARKISYDRGESWENIHVQVTKRSEYEKREFPMYSYWFVTGGNKVLF